MCSACDHLEAHPRSARRCIMPATMNYYGRNYLLATCSLSRVPLNRQAVVDCYSVCLLSEEHSRKGVIVDPMLLQGEAYYYVNSYGQFDMHSAHDGAYHADSIPDSGTGSSWH